MELSSEELDIFESFKAAGLHVESSWLKQAFLKVSDRNNLKQILFELAIHSDFRTMGRKCLPEDVGSCQKKKFVGRFVLQMDELVNISEPLDSRHTESKNRTFKFLLTDGHQNLTGMELKPIKDLKVNLPAGCKVLCQDFEVRRGIALFCSGSLKVLGGVVPALEKLRLEGIERAEAAKKRRQLVPAAQSSTDANSENSNDAVQVHDQPSTDNSQRVDAQSTLLSANGQRIPLSHGSAVAAADPRIQGAVSFEERHPLTEADRFHPAEPRQAQPPRTAFVDMPPRTAAAATTIATATPVEITSASAPPRGEPARPAKAPRVVAAAASAVSTWQTSTSARPPPPPPPESAAQDDEDVVVVSSSSPRASPPSAASASAVTNPQPLHPPPAHHLSSLAEVASRAAGGACGPVWIRAAVMGVLRFSSAPASAGGGPRFALRLRLADGSATAEAVVGDSLVAGMMGCPAAAYAALPRLDQRRRGAALSAYLCRLQAFFSVAAACCPTENGGLVVELLEVDEGPCRRTAWALLQRVEALVMAGPTVARRL